jgi:hypothetical protein
MGDEVLGPFSDPGEIADAELAARREGGRDRQSVGSARAAASAAPLAAAPGDKRLVRRSSAFGRSRQSRSQRSASIRYILTLVDMRTRAIAQITPLAAGGGPIRPRRSSSSLTPRWRPAGHVATGSVALLADLIHNFGDALTAVPLGAAFLLRSERAERGAGLAVVLAIFISACVAGVFAVEKLISPHAPDHLLALGIAGAVGFVGNEIAAPSPAPRRSRAG